MGELTVSDLVSNPVFNFWLQIVLFVLSLVGGVVLQKVVLPEKEQLFIGSPQIHITLTTIIRQQPAARKRQTKKKRRKGPIDDLLKSVEKEPAGTAIAALFLIVIIAALYLNFQLYILLLVATVTVISLVMALSALIYLRSVGLTAGQDTNRFLAIAAVLSLTGYATILFLRSPLYFPAGDFEDLLRAAEEVGGLKALEPYSFGVNLFLLMQLLGAVLFVIMVLQLISILINLWAAINLELGSRLPWLWTWLYDITERYGLVLDNRELRRRLTKLSLLAIAGLLLSCGWIFGLIDALA
jgi:hypothetical protein